MALLVDMTEFTTMAALREEGGADDLGARRRGGGFGCDGDGEEAVGAQRRRQRFRRDRRPGGGKG